MNYLVALCLFAGAVMARPGGSSEEEDAAFRSSKIDLDSTEVVISGSPFVRSGTHSLVYRVDDSAEKLPAVKTYTAASVLPVTNAITYSAPAVAVSAPVQVSNVAKVHSFQYSSPVFKSSGDVRLVSPYEFLAPKIEAAPVAEVKSADATPAEAAPAEATPAEAAPAVAEVKSADAAAAEVTPAAEAAAENSPVEAAPVAEVKSAATAEVTPAEKTDVALAGFPFAHVGAYPSFYSVGAAPLTHYNTYPANYLYNHGFSYSAPSTLSHPTYYSAGNFWPGFAGSHIVSA